METQELKSIVEALIFAADEPLSEARIRETLELENGFDFSVLIDTLNQEYQDSGRSFTIRKIAGGYQIVTQQSYSNWIKKLYLGRQKNRLSHAALETLALIAFKQPISRVDIGQIRGVNSDGVIGTLLERKLVTISGRSEAVGRPLLYSTTPEFLKYFGINDITDLPKPREIEELFSKEGMPEELLQALSQTDAQLSLPINAEGENAAPDETENKDKIPAAPLNREPSTTVETPVEIEETPVSESISEPAVEPGSGETETAALAPEISGVDINEKVVTQLEATSDETAAPLIAAAPASEGENEIAWISLNGAADQTGEEAASHALVADDFNETANELPTFAGVAEVAQKQAEEQVAGDESANEALAETANELPTFAGVAEVAAEPATEQPAISEFPLETLTETANELPTFANIDEVVSHTLTGDDKNDSAEESATKLAALESMTEEIAADFENTDTVTSDRDEVAESFVAGVDEVVALVAESPAMEVQVIEAYDVGLTDIESSPPQQNDATVEVDGWMAEELSQEEIAEPDFIKKSGDFFLEEEPRPSIDQLSAIGAETPTVLTETAPIVVSNTELSPVGGEVFLSFDAETPETVNLTETTDVAAISETAPDPYDNVAVIDFPEPTIIASVPEPPAQVMNEAASDEKLEPINFDTTPAASVQENLAVTATPSVMAELATTQQWRDDEVENLNVSATRTQPEVVSEPVSEDEITASPVIAIHADEPAAWTDLKSESSTPPSLVSNNVLDVKIPVEPAAKDEVAPPEDNDNRASTLRARVVGWFKRTFNKLLALIGATGENE